VESRERILENIRKANVVKTPLPSLSAGSDASDNIERFTEVLVNIGGRVFPVESYEAISAQIKMLFPESVKIVSVLQELPWYTPTFSHDPHDLKDVDLAIMGGHFAVAENGAVWLTDELMGDRSLPFIAQHLALVVQAKDVVPTLADAYNRVAGHSFQFGTFIAGPSKTADIEQSLVLGAHGPKSLTVFLLR
jgi:L-lactate dehydrogenase complex protein LldG